MKFSNPLRKYFDYSADTAALNDSLATAGKIADVAERLLRLQEIAQESDRQIAKLEERKDRGIMPLFFGSVALAFVGIMSCPPLIVFGIGSMIACAGVRIARGVGADPGLVAVKENCAMAQADTIRQADMTAVAQSPLFDQVMAASPQLKEKFELAAAREKIPAAAPPAPKAPSPFPAP